MMKKLCFVILFLVQEKFVEIKSGELKQEETIELLKPLPVEPTNEPKIFDSTDLIYTQDSTKHSVSQHICGETEVTVIYERKKDLDMRYVQDTITAIWRIIFSLIFLLTLLVFLIAYLTSLVCKNSTKKRLQRKQNFITTDNCLMNKNLTTHFPGVHGNKTTVLPKDSDPIYDYPCSLQSDYEKV